MENQKTKSVNLKELGEGSIFTYGGVRWAILNQDVHSRAALCLAAEIVENQAFDEEGSNDFTESTLRACLNGEFLDTLIENGADKDAFRPLTLDLLSEDGLDDYGTDHPTIGLITCNQYRTYRKHIPKANAWWWTATPWSTKSGASAF